MADPLRGRILVADDEEGLREFLGEALARDGHDVVSVEDGQAALAAAREEPFDVVVTDLKMPRLDGMAVVRALRTEQPDVEVVVLTAHGDVASAVEAMKLGVFDYLQKPLSGPSAIRELVARALARRAAIASPKPSGSSGRARLTFGAPAMRPVVEALAKVARSGATVLLQGESGTGKEVAARILHESGPRAGKPFVAINCAVLTEQLLESELFGHEKGAFTGAHAQRRGRGGRAPPGPLVAGSSSPTRAASSSTRSASSAPASRPSSCGSSRSGPSSDSAARIRSRSTSAGSPRPIAISVRWSAKAASATISTTGSRSSRSVCLRFASGARTSSLSPKRSSPSSPPPPGVRRHGSTAPSLPASAKRTGPATCASCATPSSGR
jgi:CheY-like chemotaxis protein